VSRSTDPPPLRRRSGSIPHDAVAIDPRPQRRPSFLLALGLQCPRFRRSARSARSHTANLLAQRAIRLFTPTRTPTLQGKAIGSAASLQRPQHSRRGQIPIAPAAPSVPHTPRFRALALFGRWPPQRVDGLGIPASENLVWGLSVSRKNSPCTESFCHVIRLHCGTAALLLGCAERSEPRSRVRRAEGAGLDRECADRATISLPRQMSSGRYFDLLCGFLFCRFSFPSRSLKIRFDMIRGELAIGRGNRATTLYSVDPRGSVP
jgi:hypothetical protein